MDFTINKPYESITKNGGAIPYPRNMIYTTSIRDTERTQMMLSTTNMRIDEHDVERMKEMLNT